MKRILPIFLAALIPLTAVEEEADRPVASLTLWEAIESTLLNQWNISIAREQVVASEGFLQETAGPFDPILDASYQHQYLQDIQLLGIPSSKKGHRNLLDVTYTKQTRWGTVGQAGMGIDQFHNPRLIPDRRNDTITFFQLDQPLLRNFIYNQAFADELSASYDLRAVKAQFIFTMSQQVRDVVELYWQTLLAQEILMIRQESVARLDELANSVIRLVEEGQMAETEVNQQLAQLYDEKRRMDRSIQDLFDSYNNLRLQMGWTKIPYCLRAPKLQFQEFPKLESLDKPCSVDRLMGLASQNRGDYLASLWNIQTREVQTRAARNQLLPQLDLNLGVVMRNTETFRRAESFGRPLSSNEPQRDWSIGATLSVPLWNDAAKGQYRRRQAEQQQARLTSDQLYEIIHTDVANAVRNHFALVEEIQNAEETVKWYQKALNDEIKRMKEGYSTLFIVLDFETNLNNALSNRAAAYFSYATNLVNLYFLTGQLVRLDTCSNRVFISDLQSIEPLLRDYAAG